MPFLDSPGCDDRATLTRRRCCVRATLGFVLLFPLIHSCGRPAEDSSSHEEVSSSDTLVADLYSLHESLVQRRSPIDLGTEGLLSKSLQVPISDPNWPMLTFIAGELELQHGEVGSARRAFRSLAGWGSTIELDQEDSDTWGGSALTILGLWRWLGILEQEEPADTEAVTEAIAVALRLKSTRFYRAMLESGLLPGLPQLEESLAQKLGHLAWVIGHPKRRMLFLEGLSTYTTNRLSPRDQAIVDELISDGFLDPTQLQLFRAKRLLALVTTRPEEDRALSSLKRIWDDASLSRKLRAEAGYLWCNAMRRRGSSREIIQILSEVIELSDDDEIAEMALYRRAMTQDGQVLFERDMEQLISDYPDGFLSDNALYQLATRSMFRGDLHEAIERYRQLQGLPRPHDYEDSAYFLPAMGLIGRHDTANPDMSALRQADSFLEQYLESYPNGVFRLRSLFWQGRIAEASGDGATARDRFQTVVQEAPHSYFGIRAQLHLELGTAAQSKVLPDPESATALHIQSSYRPDLVRTRLSRNSAYHRRLQSAGDSGLYLRVLKRVSEVERSYRRRLDGISLEDLESEGLMTPVGLLLALREDVLAARDSETAADNWLRLAGFAGHEIGDWPIAIEAASVVGERLPWRRRITMEMQSDPSYLATVYPALNRLQPSDLGQVLVDNAWDIGDSNELSRSLMYAVIRNESRFYAGAISPAGALGLFQFMPHVFRNLKTSLNLTAQVGTQSDFDFLSVPRNNVSVWAKWVAAERFGFDERDGVAMGLMKHHAGSGNVRSWDRTWSVIGGGRGESDREFRIDTPGFNATRVFVQATLRDTVIAEASGIVRN